MTVYQSLFRRVLFQLDPELAHRATIRLGRCAQAMPFHLIRLLKRYAVEDERLQIDVAGIRFANPLGLAAGWDKSGHVIPALSQLGFGHIEIGSISADPSSGNPKPRLHRLVADRAILVHYGLPNDGADVVAKRLSSGRIANRDGACRLGVNVVSTNRVNEAKDDSAQEVLEDYFRSVTKLHQYADYVTLNLSCPNTKDGVDFFCIPGHVRQLLERLREVGLVCPVVLKVPPNPNPEFLDPLLSEVDEFTFVKGIQFNLGAGVPPGVQLKTDRSIWAERPGAVAGSPVKQWHEHCVQQLYARMPPDRYHILSAGGIENAEDAYRRMQLGASLIQIYSALIYQGPAVIRQINEGLLDRMAQDGIKNLSTLVGTAHR